MAYYYYYQQQHHTASGSLSPETMASELTPSLPPLLLLSPQQQQQQQLTLPLVTPVIPSVTTSLPMTTNASTVEFNQQQQLSTPKLSPFLRHCEETGLFQDLRNIGAISSLTGPSSDTTTTSVPITTTAILTHMNPFDETFKQAVLQQKHDSKLAENLFSDNNNTEGELNTPFISTTTIVNTSNNHDSTLTMAALPVDMITTAVVAAPITVESMSTNTSTVPQPQQQNLFMTTSTTESSGSVLVMMMEQQQQQQHNSIISIQPQHQHRLSGEQHQQFIVPTTSNITSDIDTTTITFHDQDYSNSEGDRGKNDKAIHIENEKTTIKQTLKQNLLVKRQMQEQQKCSLVLETNQNPGQIHLHDLDIDIITTGAIIQDKGNSDLHAKEKNNNQKQQLQQKHKQELLERNRFAAKRCRMKRKQRWELLSEENRRLKLENNRLRDILAKLINRGYGDKQTTSLQIQQCQE